MLNFVNQDETGLVIGWKTGPNLLSKGDGIAAEQEVIGLQVDFDNMVAGDSGFKQMSLEQVEEKIALTATANASQYLDQIVFFGKDKPIQQIIAINCHRTVFICVNVLTDLKVRLVYHILRKDATVSFICGNILADLKVCFPIGSDFAEQRAESV